MGRLSHLTRLALGRSAFGDPVRDEDGNVVIHPSVFVYDSAEHHQRFDSRGHPANEETVRADRRMRRAQNEVLQVVGVTRTKHSQKQRLARRHSLSENELLDLVHSENLLGFLLNASVPIPMDLSSWWIRSFRARLCAFRSQAQTDLLHVLRSERRTLGSSRFFFSGLGYSFAADEFREYRYWRHPPLQHYATLSSSTAPTWTDQLLALLEDFGLFALEWPMRTRGTLQALGLIRPLPSLPWYRLQPLLSLASSSELYFQGFSELSLSDPLSFLVSVIFSPLGAGYLLERVRVSLESGIYSLLRFAIPRPENPDRISCEVEVEEMETYAGHAPGFGFGLFVRWPVAENVSFWSRFKTVFPTVARISHWLSLNQKKVRIEPHDRNDLLQASRERYSQLFRSNQRLRPDLRLTDVELRRQAISDAFAGALIDPRGSHVNIHQWADDISIQDDVASTATPDPEDVVPTLRHIQIDPATTSAANVEPVGADEAFAPAVPLGALLEPADIPETTELIPDMALQSQPWPATPEPGLSRAASLTQASNHPSVAPRAVRRPTELDEDISHIASTLRSPVQAAAGRGQAIDLRDARWPPTHRVTLLSAFSAETLARYGSSLLTSMIMLPLEVYYTRHIATIFLRSPSPAGSDLGLTPHNIAQLWPAIDVFSVGTLVQARNVLVTFAIEALVKGVVWSASTKLCMWAGKKFFLWGVA